MNTWNQPKAGRGGKGKRGRDEEGVRVLEGLKLAKDLPTVQISKLFQGEEAGSVLMVTEDEGGRRVDGDGTREGVWVGRLALKGRGKGGARK